MANIKSKVSDDVQSQFTSMIDMVFLLVIFFIVQPFKAPEMRMRAELPREGPPGVQDVAPIMLYVIPLGGDRGAWRVDNTVVTGTARELAARLQYQAAGNPDTAVTITPDPNVKFDYVLQALDACAIAQLTKVGFAKPMLRYNE